MRQTLATLATLACARAWPALDEALRAYPMKHVAAVRATVRGDVRDVLACPQTKKAINPFDGRPMPCMFDPSCPAALPDAQFERGSIGEYKPRSGCSPLHGGCAWMHTGHSTQRARAAKHLGGRN